MKVTDSGENISKELVEFLESNGIIFDKNTTTFHLDNYKKTKFYPSGRADIINNQFKDLFFLELQKEINLTWKLGLFTSTIILSRKLIENLVIEILRKKFPLNSSPTNLDLYYGKSKGRFHNFSHMLEILEL